MDFSPCPKLSVVILKPIFNTVSSLNYLETFLGSHYAIYFEPGLFSKTLHVFEQKVFSQFCLVSSACSTDHYIISVFDAKVLVPWIYALETSAVPVGLHFRV